MLNSVSIYDVAMIITVATRLWFYCRWVFNNVESPVIIPKLTKEQEKSCQHDSKPGFVLCEQYP